MKAQRVPREKTSKNRLNAIRRRVRWDAAEKSDESKSDVKYTAAGSRFHSANFAVRRFCGGILGR
jgi:hypothetical protein